jgi:hypothetical protein
LKGLLMNRIGTIVLAATLALAALPALASDGDKVKLPEASRKAMREACAADVKSLCGEVKHGGGAIMRCMAEHRANVSAGCKTAMADAQLERRAMKDAKK